MIWEVEKFKRYYPFCEAREKIRGRSKATPSLTVGVWERRITNIRIAQERSILAKMEEIHAVHIRHNSVSRWFQKTGSVGK